MSLREKRCLPCEGGIPALSPDAAHKLLAETPGWEINDEATNIRRVFLFRNYYETMAFVNAAAWVAHQEDHHPELLVGYNRCEVRYWTHAVSGLTENDFICAAKVNGLVV